MNHKPSAADIEAAEKEIQKHLEAFGIGYEHGGLRQTAYAVGRTLYLAGIAHKEAEKEISEQHNTFVKMADRAYDETKEHDTNPPPVGNPPELIAIDRNKWRQSWMEEDELLNPEALSTKEPTVWAHRFDLYILKEKHAEEMARATELINVAFLLASGTLHKEYNRLDFIMKANKWLEEHKEKV